MPESAASPTEWIGRTRESTDIVEPERLRALAAMLDRDDPEPGAGDPLPPVWHWMFFRESPRQSALGPDGHPARGGFMPPVVLPRRMWAGSRLVFHDAPRVGQRMVRRSEIADVTEKQGKTGALVFVLVRHEIRVDGALAIEEEQDIVYREAPRPGATPVAPKSAPETAAWRRTIAPDPVLLFRYSALTLNTHRIHYDPAHCAEEGYPGLVVHGPLIATLLLDLCRRERPDATVRRFDFRAMSPLFVPAPFVVAGAPSSDGASAEVWAANDQGGLAMRAEVAFG